MLHSTMPRFYMAGYLDSTRQDSYTVHGRINYLCMAGFRTLHRMKFRLNLVNMAGYRESTWHRILKIYMTAASRYIYIYILQQQTMTEIASMISNFCLCEKPRLYNIKYMTGYQILHVKILRLCRAEYPDSSWQYSDSTLQDTYCLLCRIPICRHYMTGYLDSTWQNTQTPHGKTPRLHTTVYLESTWQDIQALTGRRPMSTRQDTQTLHSSSANIPGIGGKPAQPQVTVVSNKHFLPSVKYHETRDKNIIMSLFVSFRRRICTPLLTKVESNFLKLTFWHA